MQGAGVQSLVRELKSHMPDCMSQKQKQSFLTEHLPSVFSDFL